MTVRGHQRRARRPTTLHVLPTAWFRNTWSWDVDAAEARAARRPAPATVGIDHPFLGELELLAGPGPDGTAPDAAVLRERDQHRAAVRRRAGTPYPKDGINDHVVAGAPRSTPSGAAPSARSGTGCRSRRARRSSCGCGCARRAPAGGDLRRRTSTQVVAAARAEADEFYAELTPAGGLGGRGDW